MNGIGQKPPNNLSLGGIHKIIVIDPLSRHDRDAETYQLGKFSIWGENRSQSEAGNEIMKLEAVLDRGDLSDPTH